MTSLVKGINQVEAYIEQTKLTYSTELEECKHIGPGNYEAADGSVEQNFGISLSHEDNMDIKIVLGNNKYHHH